MPTGSCRFCLTPLRHTVVDLGLAPLANSYLMASSLCEREAVYPLHLRVCERCLLVQLAESPRPEVLFGDYPYFSSYSDSWLAHALRYVDLASRRFGLGSRSQVIEIASNDGYLLRHFVERGIPALGIDPAGNVARVAIGRGVPTQIGFFGRVMARALAAEGTRADLLIGNNVLGHVPDLNDFVAGVRIVLAPHGVATFEFPHLMRLIAETQFDTIYHEHCSYFSLATARRVFAAHDLVIFDVETLSTHGGSLRVYAGPRDTAPPVEPSVHSLLAREGNAGLNRLDHYRSFEREVRRVREQVRGFLHEAKRAGRTVVGYGAPAKGNILLNACGIGADLLDYTVDRSPHKQGRFLPGTHIPIHAPDRIIETKPDYVFILPWNLREEITAQLAIVGSWGGRFVVPIPELRVCA